jgi:hypothetical protein
VLPLAAEGLLAPNLNLPDPRRLEHPLPAPSPVHPRWFKDRLLAACPTDLLCTLSTPVFPVSLARLQLLFLQFLAPLLPLVCRLCQLRRDFRWAKVSP